VCCSEDWKCPKSPSAFTYFGTQQRGCHRHSAAAMDGPSVNCKLFELISNDLKHQANINLLNVGSCSLHQVHGAFQVGARSSGWEVDEFLSLYWLFKVHQQGERISRQ